MQYMLPLLTISENEFMHVDPVITVFILFSCNNRIIIRGRGCAHDRYILVSFFSSRMNKKKIDYSIYRINSIIK